MAPRHQAILEVGFLAQCRDEKIRGDDQYEHDDKPDQSRPPVVGFMAVVVRITHAGTLPGIPSSGKRSRAGRE
jgi:hypothetical protein